MTAPVNTGRAALLMHSSRPRVAQCRIVQRGCTRARWALHARPVADVAYKLHADALDGGYTVERSEIVGRFGTREEARQWMLDTSLARQMRDRGYATKPA